LALFLIWRGREGIGRVAHAMLDKPKDAIAGYDASGSRLQWLHICACYGWAWGQEVFHKMGRLLEVAMSDSMTCGCS
jgi:hypothetical protein